MAKAGTPKLDAAPGVPVAKCPDLETVAVIVTCLLCTAEIAAAKDLTEPVPDTLALTLTLLPLTALMALVKAFTLPVPTTLAVTETVLFLTALIAEDSDFTLPVPLAEVQQKS